MWAEACSCFLFVVCVQCCCSRLLTNMLTVFSCLLIVDEHVDVNLHVGGRERRQVTFVRAFVSLWSAPHYVVDTAAAWSDLPLRPGRVIPDTWPVKHVKPVKSQWTKHANFNGRSMPKSVDEACQSQWTKHAKVSGRSMPISMDEACQSQWTKHAKVNGRSMPKSVDEACQAVE